MENKINIAELLKDSPKGMKLYSPIFGDVYLDKIRPHLAIVVTTDKEQGNLKEEFLYDGRYGMNGECMLFPSKGKTTWEGFVPSCKFKDGDIIYNQGIKAIAIFYKQTNDNTISHCFLNKREQFKISHYHSKFLYDWRFATEEEKQKLFDAIKANGYKWNSDTKTLEKLVEPIFRINNVIRHKERKSNTRIVDIKDGNYIFENGDKLLIYLQNNYEFVTDKFDITALKPFKSKVLVRDTEEEKWKPAIWGYYDVDHTEGYPYETVGGNCFCLCIPYEGNEHLRGTNDNCDDFYKTWK